VPLAEHRLLAGRRLYLCTPDRPDLLAFVTACVSGGVDIVQLRDKVLDAAPLLDRAGPLAVRCRELGVPFVLNDRPDLALACGADGVHVGQGDAPPSLCRQILGDGALVGRSTHAPGDLAAAEAEPVDYVSAGPVVATPTKPGRPGVGLSYVTHAALSSTRPVFVTGGAAPDTVAAMVRAGGSRVVVVRWLTESTDPAGAARALRGALDGALQATTI
jgi:thiamine-phosphate pyrophosphorylase